MAHHNHILLRGLSLFGGLLLVAAGTYLNVSHAAETDGAFNSPTCIAIVALAFGSVLAVPVMCACWHTGRCGLAVVALVALVAGELFGLQISAERLLAARDQRAHQAKAANAPRDVVLAKIASLEADRRRECSTGYGDKCAKARVWEDAARADLAKLSPARSVSLVADVTGLPAWFVEVVPALAFSSSVMLLGLVLVGFGGHPASQSTPQVELVTLSTARRDEAEEVIDWVREFRGRHGRNPQIPEVQEFFSLPKTTAWRRIRSSL